jgi:hypothetical protein
VEDVDYGDRHLKGHPETGTWVKAISESTWDRKQVYDHKITSLSSFYSKYRILDIPCLFIFTFSAACLLCSGFNERILVRRKMSILNERVSS